MATIKDVAREAGVSISTVSHSLSGKRPISEPTRRRVLEAVERLGYRPNWNARSLVSGRTRVIGLVVADISNPFYPTAARGVEDVAIERDYSLVICSTDGNERREREYIDVLEARQVDGIVYMAGLGSNRRLAELVARGGIPVVTADERLRDLDLPGVFLMNERAGAMVADHLAALGHTRLGFIGGPRHLPTVGERLAGFAAGAASHGLALADGWVTYADNRAEGGQLAAAVLMALDVPPTAVFVANDMMALGVLEYCRSAGLAVPGDLSVVGVDDLPVARLMGLTTIHQPMYEIGSTAARLLFGILESDDRPATVLLQPELVVRTSTGPPVDRVSDLEARAQLVGR
jgi:DNA-binding LacI/PurR family transcriptional regulator